MVGIEPFQEWRCGGDCNVATRGNHERIGAECHRTDVFCMENLRK
jgi:hypothetical protein